MIVPSLILVSTLFVLLAVFVRRKYNYWARQNVPFIEPRFPFGNFKDLITKPLAELSKNHYEIMKDAGPFYGVFLFIKPLITITDLDLIKKVLIKDFNFFPDRGQFYNARDDPLTAHLFHLEGNPWRSLRNRLTPTFTTGKMKMMFSSLKCVSDNFSEFIVKTVGQGKELEIRDVMARFTIDVIGSCVFGIECNSFKEPNSEFRKFGQQIFDNPRHCTLVRLLMHLYPEIGRALGMKVLRSDASEFFYKLIVDTVHYREENSVVRQDFMNYLIEMKNNEKTMNLDELAAQSFIFFGAGFETSSSTQTFCLHELALNQECQEKARQCVLNALEKHGGITYDAVYDMQYLEQCVNETLRLYPSLGVLERKTFQNYKIPDTDIIIPKGMFVHLPIYAIQRDEQYYPNPNVFDPERFRPEEVTKRHMCTFLPFGEGPRVCIGLRFGMLQSKVGLAIMLSRYRVTPCSKSVIPMQLAVNSAVTQPKGDVWLRLVPL